MNTFLFISVAWQIIVFVTSCTLTGQQHEKTVSQHVFHVEKHVTGQNMQGDAHTRVTLFERFPFTIFLWWCIQADQLLKFISYVKLPQT